MLGWSSGCPLRYNLLSTYTQGQFNTSGRSNALTWWTVRVVSKGTPVITNIEPLIHPSIKHINENQPVPLLSLCELQHGRIELISTWQDLARKGKVLIDILVLCVALLWTRIIGQNESWWVVNWLWMEWGTEWSLCDGVRDPDQRWLVTSDEMVVLTHWTGVTTPSVIEDDRVERIKWNMKIQLEIDRENDLHL